MQIRKAKGCSKLKYCGRPNRMARKARQRSRTYENMCIRHAKHDGAHPKDKEGRRLREAKRDRMLRRVTA